MARLKIVLVGTGGIAADTGCAGPFFRMSRNYDRAWPHIYEGMAQPERDDSHDDRDAIDVDKINGRRGFRLAYQGLFDGTLNGYHCDGRPIP